jgi:hypothetical protein
VTTEKITVTVADITATKYDHCKVTDVITMKVIIMSLEKIMM